MKFTLSSVCALLALVLQMPLQAQVYPSKPIRVIVPYEAGGAADIFARTIAPLVGKELGQTIVVENKAGAGSAIGAALVARSDPDGYTYLMGGSPTAINASFVPSLPYDTMRDLVAVSPVARTPYFLLAGKGLQAQSVQDLIALAKKSPGTVTYASSGVGNRPHLAAAQFAQLTGTQLLHVAYKGTGPATNDLVAGHVGMMFAGLVTFQPFIDAGQVRVLAAATRERYPSLPQTPTFAEAGVPGFYPDVWYGFLTRRGTPQPMVEKFAAAVQKAIIDPKIAEKFAALGGTSFKARPAEFQKYFSDEVQQWQEFFRLYPQYLKD